LKRWVLEHVSGYHMAVVAGIMFFTVRALFALMPAFANRHPIKKWVTAIPRRPRPSPQVLKIRAFRLSGSAAHPPLSPPVLPSWVAKW
jgi:hypothetical protein